MHAEIYVVMSSFTFLAPSRNYKPQGNCPNWTLSPLLNLVLLSSGTKYLYQCQKPASRLIFTNESYWVCGAKAKLLDHLALINDVVNIMPLSWIYASNTYIF